MCLSCMRGLKTPETPRNSEGQVVTTFQPQDHQTREDSGRKTMYNSFSASTCSSIHACFKQAASEIASEGQRTTEEKPASGSSAGALAGGAPNKTTRGLATLMSKLPDVPSTVFQLASTCTLRAVT